MSSIPQLRLPVRVSELDGIPKSCDKQILSDKKKFEPVKIKDLLGSRSKNSLFSADNKSKPPAGKMSTNKLLQKSRKSLLTQPNSIVQKHIHQLINETSHSTIIEDHCSEIHEEESAIINQRSTVIKNALQSVEHKNNGTYENKTIAIPKIIIKEDENIETVNKHLEASFINKENIPPPLKQIEFLIENKLRQYKNIHPQFVNLFRTIISRMEKLELEFDKIKQQHTLQMNLSQKIYNLIKIKLKLPTVVLSVPDISSTSKILSEHRLQDKHDSFISLEEELNIKQLKPINSSIFQTPKNKKYRQPNGNNNRALREYLAMKSSTNFLETPEPNGFRRNIDSNDNGTPSRNKKLRRLISSKLFNELQNLYLESPPDTEPSCQ